MCDILSAIENDKINARTLNELRESLSKKFNVEHPRDLSGVFLFLQIPISTGVSTVSFIETLDEGLSDWELPDEFVENWNKKKEIISKISDTPLVRYISKKNELYYRHEHHIHDLRIISDLRPVLSDERDEISEFILFNKLFISYSDPNESETYLELPIGVDELMRLQKQINVALDKTNVIQGELRKKIGRETTVFTRRSSK